MADLYLLCHTCREKVYLCEDTVNLGDIQEIQKFAVAHGIYHDVRLGDEETEYDDKSMSYHTSLKMEAENHAEEIQDLQR